MVELSNTVPSIIVVHFIHIYFEYPAETLVSAENSNGDVFDVEVISYPDIDMTEHESPRAQFHWQFGTLLFVNRSFWLNVLSGPFPE